MSQMRATSDARPAPLEASGDYLDGLPQEPLEMQLLELGQVDPWRVLRPALAGTQPVVAWSGSEGDVAIGVGVAVAFHGNDPGSLAAVRAKVADWSRATSVEQAEKSLENRKSESPLTRFDAAGLPLFWVGTRFDADAEMSGPWENWPSTSAVLPEIVIGRFHGRSWMRLAGSPQRLRYLEGAARELLRSARKLDGGQGSPSPPQQARRLIGPAVQHLKPSEQSQHAQRSCLPGWEGKVTRAQLAMRDGDAEKVVLARAQDWVGSTDLAHVLMALREQQNGCTVFCWREADGRAFVGASPEPLVQVTGRQIHACALAGTAARPAKDEGLAARALLASSKDQREHRFVVDALRRTLGPLCAHLKVDQAASVRQLRSVLHLETRFEGVLERPIHILELVQRLHPTPAVSGFPEAASMAWLRQNEGFCRGWYAAPMGWTSASGGGAFVVALRSALIFRDRAVCFAGAGLTPASKPEAEWAETCLKLNPMFAALTEGAKKL